MWDVIERLWRYRWTVALLALVGFIYGCQEARAQWDISFMCSDDENLTVNPKRVLCDQGKAYVNALNYAQYMGNSQGAQSRVIDGVCQFPPCNISWYVGQTRQFGTWQSLSRTHVYRNTCAVREELAGWTSPTLGGKACFEGCSYNSVINVCSGPDCHLTSLFPDGAVCADGDTLVPGPEPEPDPCDATPIPAGCPGREEPGEPEEPEEPGDTDSSPGTGGSNPGGGQFPGGGSPGGEGHPGAGEGGGAGEEGQVCGGPNQRPCNVTLGDATLPSGCNQPPTCAGDPVSCGILFTTWRTACNGGEQPEWTKVQGDGTEGAGPEPEHGPVREAIFDPTARLDQGGFGGGSSCPSMGTINFKVGSIAHSFNFDSLPWWCDLLFWTRTFNIMLGAFVSVGIILGWNR